MVVAVRRIEGGTELAERLVERHGPVCGGGRRRALHAQSLQGIGNGPIRDWRPGLTLG